MILESSFCAFGIKDYTVYILNNNECTIECQEANNDRTNN